MPSGPRSIRSDAPASSVRTARISDCLRPEMVAKRRLNRGCRGPRLVGSNACIWLAGTGTAIEAWSCATVADIDVILAARDDDDWATFRHGGRLPHDASDFDGPHRSPAVRGPVACRC